VFQTKQKLHNRILPLLLALATLMSLLPTGAFSLEPGQTETVPVVSAQETPEAAPENSFALGLTLEGAPVEQLLLDPHEKRELRAECSLEGASYQWQILHPQKEDLWIKISNATNPTLSVSPALICNMLDGEGAARLRCHAWTEAGEAYSDPLTVVLGEKEAAVTVLSGEAAEVLPLEPEAPEEAVPEETVPEETVPEETVPAETVPEETDPAETAPEETVPAETVPEETVPAETVPEETVPAETVPAETNPEETAPVETASSQGPRVLLADGPERDGQSDVMPLAEGEDDSDFVTVTIEYVRYDILWENGKMVVDGEGNPVLETQGVQAFTSYIATLQKGTDLQTSVNNPTMVGYDTFLEDAAVSSTKVDIDLTDITENVVYTVKYKPAKVSYSVRYFFQNIYDDLYAENISLKPSISDEGYTGATPPTDQMEGAVPGFTALYYQPDAIAADGSTVFEVYYERNYYLMEFDCNGGYGAETLYNRYGSYVSVPTPVRPGYVFQGWNLMKRGDDPDYVPDDTIEGHLDEMPPYHSAYQAVWTTSATTYTVVYWRENADDNGYSYWDSVQIGVDGSGNLNNTVHSNDHVSGTDHITAAGLSEAQYFTYNAVKTEYEESQREDLASDGKVIVEGDGSTVVNVYYSRKVFTLQFNVDDNFTLPADSHVHTDGKCEYKLICGIADHVHSAECVSTLTCTIPVHEAHTAECRICGYAEEHAHSDACLQCGKTEHTHTEDCCTVDEHTHSILCYNPNSGYQAGSAAGNYGGWNTISSIANPQAGRVYKYRTGMYGGTTYYNFFYDGSDWYYLGTGTEYRGLLNGQISNPNQSGDYSVSTAAATMICGKTAHDHTSGCVYCTKPAGHTQNADCCTLTEHTHTRDCYRLSAGTWGNAVTAQNTISALNNGYGTQASNGIVQYNYSYYFKVGNTWYQISGLSDYYWNENYYQNVNITDCGTAAHTHDGTSCQYCCQEEHTHADACYCDKTEHTHTDSCYTDVIHTHTDACYTWTCGASAHTHTAECYSACVKPVSYVEGTGNNTKFYIKAKYNQTIGDIWPTSANYHGLYGWEVEGSTSLAVSKKINMTPDLCDTSDNLRIITANTQGTSYTVHLYYMFESFDQSSPENGNERKLRNGIYYDKSVLYYQDVESTSATFSQKDITGMTADGVDSARITTSEYNNFLYYNRARASLKFHNINTTVHTVSDLMYEYPLKDILVDGQPASAYVPPYPSTYEPGAYEFGGWYTTPDCYPGTEVDWKDGAMPVTDLEVYAKWTPILRNVTFYSAYSDIALDEADDTDRVYHFMKAEGVPHGQTLGSTYFDIPEHPGDLDRETNGGPEAEMYDFIGWFYMDEDNKKRFAPDSMEVTKDLVLFAEWNTSVDTEYEVRYVLRDDVSKENTVTEQQDYAAGSAVAVFDAGHASVGKTKTFTAKGLGDLYEDFQKKFFPTVNSHSILMEPRNLEDTQNRFTFEYVYDDTVYYKVRYLDYATKEPLHEELVRSTDEAVITVKFQPVKNYIPQSFYIRKALAYDGNATESSVIEENVITFYYVRDTEHGLYSIEYYKEDVDSTDSNDRANYTQYESIVGSADLEEEITAELRTYQGFDYKASLDTVITYNTDGTVKKEVVGSGHAGIVDYTGLTIQIYYSRNEYPYVIRYVESGTNKELKTVVSDNAKFEAIIGHTGPAEFVDDKGTADTSDDVTYEYYLPDATDAERYKEMTIRTTGNTMDFYYSQKKVAVQYHPICLDGNVPDSLKADMKKIGTVSLNAETAISSDNLAGSTAIAAEGFRFVGWYQDEACTEPVDPAWVVGGTHLKPGTLYQNAEWVNHYYALFAPVQENLKIQKNGKDLEGKTFLFRVTGKDALGQQVDLTVSIQGTGSVTVKDLYCGTYTVTELTDWSWTSTCTESVKTVTLTTKDKDGKGNLLNPQITMYEVTFENAAKAVDWLQGESAPAENQFRINTP